MRASGSSEAVVEGTWTGNRVGLNVERGAPEVSEHDGLPFSVAQPRLGPLERADD